MRVAVAQRIEHDDDEIAGCGFESRQSHAPLGAPGFRHPGPLLLRKARISSTDNLHAYSVRSDLRLNRKKEIMGACTCGYTRDEEKNCDGTHKVVKAVKQEMAEKLEANGFPHASEYVKNN